MCESAEKVENAQTAISNIVMHYSDEMTNPDELHENALYGYFLGKDGSEMMHSQKDYEVKTYIHREFSANQNVTTVGKKNDEDHAVPSIREAQ